MKKTIYCLGIVALALTGCATPQQPSVYEFSLTYNSDEAVIAAPINGKYSEGKEINIAISEKEPYVFKGLFDETKTLVSNEKNYTFNLSKDTYLTALFDKKVTKYNFFISTEGNGIINGTTNGTYEEGTEISLTSTASEGFIFDGYYENNQLVHSEETYKFEIKKDTSLVANFKEEDKKPEPPVVEPDPDKPIEPDKPINPDITEDPQLIGKIVPGQNGVTRTYFNVVPINEYYKTFDSSLTGDLLRTEIRQKTSPKKRFSYGDTSNCLRYTDEDVENQGRILGIYDSKNFANAWDGGKTWNKEHVWPQSRMEGVTNFSSTAKSDMHNLRACTPNVNSSRGNDGYDNSSSGNYYFPNIKGDWRGDVARCVFYMYCQFPQLKLSDSVPGTGDGFTMGKVSVLKERNKLDPVSDFERPKNLKVSMYQGNRNIFVDYPKLVDKLFK